MKTKAAKVEKVKLTKIQQSRLLKQNIPLFIMFAPVLIYFIVFKYIPMGGLIIAFKSFNLRLGIFGSPWVGLRNFELIFMGSNTLNVIRNSLMLSVLGLIFGFPAPIILALLLNEVRKNSYKRTIQTIIYLPNFFSWVILGGIILNVFSQERGIVNYFIKLFTGAPYPFLYRPIPWIAIFLASGIWKGAGFGTIIYLAALSGVDPSLYEAAIIDGANKWTQVTKITLPSIKTTVATLFILATGGILDVGFDQVYVLQNSTVFNVSDVISTFIFRVGVNGARYDLATAMGLFDSLVGLILVVSTNAIAKKFGEGIW
jgi:putative aldouronate transport system permease protein